MESLPRGNLRITRGARDLFLAPDTPAGEQWIYQVGFPFQLAPTTAALFCGIRLGKCPVVDMEAGNDLVMFDRLDSISADRAIPLNRYRPHTHPRTGEALTMTPHGVKGGFVPLGAKRVDGSPHPHAGTGFGLTTWIGIPRGTTRLDVTGDVCSWIELQQFAYDGAIFRVTRSDKVRPHEFLPGLHLVSAGQSAAIASGDDLLLGISTGEMKRWDSGVGRWRRGADGCWRLVDYTLVARDAMEPTLIRDIDGALLLGVRPWIPTHPSPNELAIRRSTDEGRSWERIPLAANFFQAAPIMLNRAADGTPYIATNRYREPVANKFAKREMIWLWPLSDDRCRLLDPIVVRDGAREFGPAPHGTPWRIDHPLGQTVRLADAQWHHVLCYRVLEDAEMRTDAGATTFTGCYVEEVISSGPQRAVWQF